jgi:hypothetical protein
MVVDGRVDLITKHNNVIDKQDALKYAIEITKEAMRGGSGTPAPHLLETTFKKILELLPEANGPITD